MDACKDLRQLLEKKCPGAIFKDDDIKKLVDEGFHTEAALQAGTKEELREELRGVLPNRRGVVNVLVSAFFPPADSAKLPAAGQNFQLFVESASRNYEKWQKESLEVEKNSFMEVEADPFHNFSGAFLIWVRKCYVRLKDILVEEAKKVGQSFILLGTAGIGKSLFTIFWICYLATEKKRIVWKLGGRLHYLLDFSQEVATIHGPVDELNTDLQQVLNDKHSWLIIDGGEKTPSYYECSILLACSAKKENHHEFSKGGLVKIWYLSVWTEDEIEGFCEAFERRESKFSNMDVPDKATALANFKQLGGVPRFVLRAGKMKLGTGKLQEAVAAVTADNCMQVYSGLFNANWSDRLIHMFVDDEGDYKTYKYDFACSEVRDSIDQQLMKVGKQHLVNFLEQNIQSRVLATMWGHMYENVAHIILSEGGEFKRKRVSEKGVEVQDTLEQKKLKLFRFKDLQGLTKLKKDYPDGAYCQPSSLNFASADAVIVPGTLVQYFKNRRGTHGYQINGLKQLDSALNLENYSLWSCVPEESFEKTGFQNWLNTDGKICQLKDEESRVLVQKMQQYVVEVDYRKYNDC